MNIDTVDWFIERLYEYKNEAIVWQDNSYSYEWLLNKIDEWYKILIQKDIYSGKIVAIESDFSPDSIGLFLALMKNNNVIVPLSSVTDEEKKEFISIAEVEYIIKFYKDGNWDLVNLNRSVIKNELMKSFVEKKKAGLVLFSSGSTGKSKGILHNLVKLLMKFQVKRHCLKTITFLLLDHIGGINTLFYILSNGGTIVALSDRTATTVCRAIEQFKVELLPTSPTFLNLLILSEEFKNHDLTSLKMITYGTEPMAENTLIRLNKIFPEVTLLQTYGLSELGILRSKSKANNSKWFKIGGEGFNIKIINNELLIKAESSMLGYLNAPNPFDHEGYFHTGDIVEVDGEYIKIVGRDAEIINVGGQKVFPVEVENVIMEMPEVEDVIVYGEKNPITGNIVIAKVKPKIDISLNEMKKKIRSFCKNKLSGYKIPVKVIVAKELQYSLRYKKMRGNF